MEKQCPKCKVFRPIDSIGDMYCKTCKNRYTFLNNLLVGIKPLEWADEDYDELYDIRKRNDVLT